METKDYNNRILSWIATFLVLEFYLGCPKATDIYKANKYFLYNQDVFLKVAAFSTLLNDPSLDVAK